ncbi:hypothetical protein GPL17_36830 [Bradyrhizobium yuanmingense]|nr:hypothetical protein [Bradyrhizobium yuanmingense]
MTEPTLRKRGSFRQDYAGSTLRDHYGLTRPRERILALPSSDRVIH